MLYFLSKIFGGKNEGHEEEGGAESLFVSFITSWLKLQ